MPPSLQIKPLGPLASALTQLFQSPQSNIRGVETSTWFGPLQPVKPIAPVGTEPRGFQYMPGQNLIYTPRHNEPLGFDELRKAASYDMVRVILENAKDQLCRRVPVPRLRRLPGESGKDYAKRKADSAIVQRIAELIAYPAGDYNDNARSEFTRHILEDMLVIDAPAILFRTTKSKDLVEIRAIDGATITRYIDEQGFTPLPPSPAYAQLWQGMPMVDLTTDQLFYCPRNILPGHLYGLSPVEQVCNFIRFGSQRLEFQTRYYTDGTLPDAIQIVPPGVPVDKIQEAQAWMDSDLSGNLAKRRKLRLLQGFAPDGKDQVIFPKEVLLTDGTDDLIFRALFYAFGQSAARVIPMMNRAQSEQNAGEAEKQGLEPFADWLLGVWNRIVQRYLGFKEYEVAFEEDTDVDPLKQAQIQDLQLRSGQATINENREQNGQAPSDLPEADMHMVITATGPMPLSMEEEVKRAKAKADAMPKPEPGAFGGGGAAAQKAIVDGLSKLHDTAEKVLDAERVEKNAPAPIHHNFEIQLKADKLEIPQNVTIEAPTVNVTPPAVHVKVAAPTVNVAAPEVHVAAPNVEVKAADVHVPAPVVKVTIPKRKVKISKTIKRDEEGNIQRVDEEHSEE